MELPNGFDLVAMMHGNSYNQNFKKFALLETKKAICTDLLAITC